MTDKLLQLMQKDGHSDETLPFIILIIWGETVLILLLNAYMQEAR